MKQLKESLKNFHSFKYTKARFHYYSSLGGVQASLIVFAIGTLSLGDQRCGENAKGKSNWSLGLFP